MHLFILVCHLFPVVLAFSFSCASQITLTVYSAKAINYSATSNNMKFVH